MFETIKKIVHAQIIFCIKDTIYCFLITYLLLDTINFARSRICLSEDGNGNGDGDGDGDGDDDCNGNGNCDGNGNGNGNHQK
jgi:hypothetical protein